MKKSNAKPIPPAALSAEAKSWWTKIVEEFEVDDPAGFLLLGSAMEAFDDTRKAQVILTGTG